jgi:hyperosmotically inducible protein
MKMVSRYASILVVAFAVSAGACTSGNTDTGARVDQALKDANVKNVNVDYDRSANVIHLKGKVNSPDEKERAEQVAASAVGTSGKVLNELEVEGTDSDRIESVDDQIENRLNDSVKADPQLTEQDIDFRVSNGMVTITGEVKTAAQKARVGDLVKGTPGVKDMANELHVAGRDNAKDSDRNRR